MIEDPNFSLDLDPPWQELPGEDADFHNLCDHGRGIVATLSAMPIDIAGAAIDQFAAVLIDTRLHAEADAARALGREAIIYEPIVVSRPWGHAAAYYGHDGAGRQFSYSGIVTRRCVINLYMSSERLSEQELMAAMDEIGSRITFDRTPLEAGGAPQ